MGLTKIGYFLSEGIRGIKNNKKGFFSSVIAIAVCLFMMSNLVIVSDVVRNTIERESKKNQYLVYVEDGLTDVEAYALQDKLIEVPYVASASFISNEQAKKEFEDYLGEESIADLPSDIFRHRYSITLRNNSEVKDAIIWIETLDGVAYVSGSPEISEGFANMEEMANVVVVAICALLLVISLIVITNTLSYSTKEHIEEAYIMRLCGVSEYHIRMPRCYEGIIVGVLGAIFAYLAQWGCYFGLYQVLTEQGVRSSLEMPLWGAYTFMVAELDLVSGIGLGLIAGILSGKDGKHPRKTRKKKVKGVG